MPSLIPEYNYDIFISYRQKDNKYDGWITEFVGNLRRELEATFKEEISLYFDINPHDGLLETHDVDESLKEKLKCLIFIPVISRTYCDPKSFAWEHEFKAFLEVASKDKFGNKIKLPNGNITSRVLPIQIYDLSTEDMVVLEGALGGHLRSIEFIYKEPGVNRPLKPDDDDKVNLNRTKYRNQINKTANAIDEIIAGLKGEMVLKEKSGKSFPKDIKPERKDDKKEVHDIINTRPPGSAKKRLITWLPIFAVVLIAVLFFYPKLVKKDKFGNLKGSDGKISIAVIPFENHTGDTTLNWFGKGISSLIINGLGTSTELAVSDDFTMSEAMEGMTQVYTAGFTPAVARDIARKTKAETYITGSFQGRENTYWILVNLVSTETGNILWTNKVEGDLKSSAYLVLADSLCNDVKNYLEIKALEEIADLDFKEVYPQSAEAYRYFIDGMDLIMKQNYPAGYESLIKALEVDSTFALASFYLAYTCNIGQYKSDMSNQWLGKAMLYKDRIPSKYRLWLEMWNSCLSGKSMRDISRYCDQLSVSGINTRFFWADLGVTYFDFLHEYPKAVNAFDNVIRLNQELSQDFKFIVFWERFLQALHITGAHEREKEIAELGLKAVPGEANYFYYYLSLCALSRSDTIAARKYLANYLAVHKSKGTVDYIVELWLGNMHRDANLPDQAEPHYRKAVELAPLSYDLKAWLGKFLIYSGRNVNEGMILIQNVLEKYPEESYIINIEGWGYYKQGDYEKAMERLNRSWELWEGFNIEIYENLETVKKALAAGK